MSEQNQNEHQMQEMQEAIALRHLVNSNEGYTVSNPVSVSNIVRSNERFITEAVDIPTSSTLVLEQLIKQFNEYKKLSVIEFTARKIGHSEFEKQQVAMQEAMNYLYDIISVRYQYAQLEPGKWSELIVGHIMGDNPRTEKEKLLILKSVIEKRWKADEKLAEFDGFLRLKKLKENL
jgi:hypothetical protein